MSKWHNVLDQLPPAGEIVIAKLRNGQEVKSVMNKDCSWDEDISPLFWAFLSENETEEQADNVNHPKHYTSDPSGVECIQITRYRNFNVGNAIKYLWRAGLKDDAAMDIKTKTIEDLKKAVFYINDEIKRLKEEKK